MAPPDDIDWSQLEDINIEGVNDATKHDNMTLLKMFNELTEDLKNMGEAVHPKTQAARDIHSWRAAILIELHRRGLM
jgi:meiotically up-regulated gene 157 (Mug157) protein